MKIGIYSLGNGKYQVSHLNAEGKRVRYKFNSYREANTYANQVKNIRPSASNEDSSRKLSDLMQIYLELNPDSPLKNRSTDLFKSFIKYFGHLSCSDLNKPICNYWLQQVKITFDYSSRTLRTCKYTYSKFFEYLAQNGFIEKNYMAEVYVKLGTRKKNREFLSEQQILKILEGFERFSKQVCYPVIYFLLHTGCKIGEALNVKWENLDLEAGTVYFPATASANGRLINLSPRLLEFFKQHPRIGEHVFLNEQAEPWSVSTFYRRMKNDRTAIDLGHDWDAFTFRHTFAYHFLRKGKTLQQLQVVLGHRNIQQTIQFYGDIVSELEQKSSPY